jgi:uncharacterized protein with PhoU and TrkA domain
MLDLAYSAALFHSHELAEEVIELEERVDHLANLLNMSIMLAARDAEDAEELVGISIVAAAANEISDSAADIASLVIREIGIHPIIREAFKKIEERLIKTQVKESSDFVGKSIEELELAAMIGVDIIAIRRGKCWIINPNGEERIASKDILFMRGAPLGIERSVKLTQGSTNLGDSEQAITTTGKFSGEVAEKLAILKDMSELMIDLAYSSLFLNSKELAEEVEILEERVNRIHEDYEILVLSCDIKTEESRDFLGLIRIGGTMEKIANAAAKIAETILRGEDPHPILKQVVDEAEETVTRIKVSRESYLVDKTLRLAQIPEETGMWVIIIRRGTVWIRPKPNTRIKAGDILIASGYAEGEEDLRKLASK